MEFLHAAIALLASMVLVLAGMVGWLYWQQQRMFQSQSNITLVIGELARALTPPKPEEPMVEEAPVVEEAAPETEDDRVSVEEGPEVVDTVVDTVLDTDSLDSKTKKELQDILTKRGIPFGKNDNKGVLISLLKATS